MGHVQEGIRWQEQLLPRRQFAQSTHVDALRSINLMDAKKYKYGIGLEASNDALSSSFPQFLRLSVRPSSPMSPPGWATPEQLAFLVQEDEKWLLIKAGGTTLKGFYSRTTKTFLDRWQVTPDPAILEEAEGDEAVVQELVEKSLHKVSLPHYTKSSASHLAPPHSASHGGIPTATARRNLFRLPPNRSWISLGRTLARNHGCKSGRHFVLFTTTRKILRSVRR